MARGRKPSTKTLDEKIEKQQEVLAKSKEKYGECEVTGTIKILIHLYI